MDPRLAIEGKYQTNNSAISIYEQIKAPDHDCMPGLMCVVLQEQESMGARFSICGASESFKLGAGDLSGVSDEPKVGGNHLFHVN